MNLLEYPSKMPCGKIITKKCNCPDHCKHETVGSYTSPDAIMSDYVIVSYWCTRCYRRGIIKAVKRWE